MSKLSWNAFVTKYPKAGHLVTTGTQPDSFKKPSGLSPKNQKHWPGIPELVREALTARLQGDWAHTKQSVPGTKYSAGKLVRAKPATAYLFVFENKDDAILAARLLRSGTNGLGTSPDPAFASLTKGATIDMTEYKKLVTALGYL